MLNEFVSTLRPGDVALLYYSGHGLQIDGENYLIPTDFSAASESEAKYAAYSASRAVQQIADRNTKLNIVILDACRDNPFRFSARSLRRGWAPMDTGRGTYIAFATGPGSTASDGPAGTNGLFTRHLLNALRISGLGLDDVFARVREAVYADSGAQQLPWSASSVIGEFVFTKGGASLPQLANETSSAVLTSAKPDVSRRGLQPIPPSPEPLANTAGTYIQSGDYHRAIEEYTRLLSSSPDASLYRERGRARLLAEQFAEATDDFSRAIGMAPSDTAALYYRSVAYAASRHYELAIRDATAAIAQQPDMMAAFLSRANAYVGAGLYPPAIKDCGHIISLNAEVGQAYVIRGTAYRALGQLGAAASDFRKAAQLTMQAEETTAAAVTRQ